MLLSSFVCTVYGFYHYYFDLSFVLRSLVPCLDCVLVESCLCCSVSVLSAWWSDWFRFVLHQAVDLIFFVFRLVFSTVCLALTLLLQRSDLFLSKAGSSGRSLLFLHCFTAHSCALSVLITPCNVSFCVWVLPLRFMSTHFG